MRALFAHSLLALALAVAASMSADAAGVPSPIGNLSDYGAVFDRHGRDEVNASVAEVSKLLRIDVYILATWENAYPTTADLAQAAFAAWGLASRRAILAVYVRSGQNWTAAVVASASVRGELGAIDRRLEDRMADLVKHRRVGEAVRALFAELRNLPAAQRAASALAKTPPGGGRNPSAGVVIGSVAAGVLALALLIRWRVCPRCAGLLRVARSRFSDSRRVYSCRRCGYRRGG